jgi:hypothetical protein
MSFGLLREKNIKRIKGCQQQLGNDQNQIILSSDQNHELEN